MKLYHATKATRRDAAIEIAEQIVREGFIGSNVWDYTDVVFLADKPLPGFGGWSDAWVIVEIPDAMVAIGQYAESDWDNDQYKSKCYCFKTEYVNRFPRYATE